MNYQTYELQNYRIPLDDYNDYEGVALMNDGTLLDLPAYNNEMQYDYMVYTQSNYINRNKENGTYPVMFLVNTEYDSAGTHMLLFVTTNVEYLSFKSSSGSVVYILADYGGNNGMADLNDANWITNYPHYHDGLAFSSYTYGAFNDSINNQNVIFDYTNLYYADNSYYNDVYSVRGEDLTYYKTFFEITWSNGGYFDIGYGAPTLSVYQNSYQTGYGNGYNNGHTQGFDEGYQVGLNTNSGISQEPATAFSYIGQAFNAVGGIMNIEVLPHITLGTCFSIPLIFVLILTIFKLVRK